MDALSVIARAESLGVALELDTGRLSYTGPETAVAEILPDLRAHRDEIIRALTTDPKWLELADGSIVRTGLEHLNFTQPESRYRALIGTDFPPRESSEPPAGILARPIYICSRCNLTRVLRAVPGSAAGVCFYCEST